MISPIVRPSLYPRIHVIFHASIHPSSARPPRPHSTLTAAGSLGGAALPCPSGAFSDSRARAVCARARAPRSCADLSYRCSRSIFSVLLPQHRTFFYLKTPLKCQPSVAFATARRRAHRLLRSLPVPPSAAAASAEASSPRPGLRTADLLPRNGLALGRPLPGPRCTTRHCCTRSTAESQIHASRPTASRPQTRRGPCCPGDGASLLRFKDTSGRSRVTGSRAHLD